MSQNAQTIPLIPLPFLEDVAECIKVMAHPVRLRMVDILAQGEFSVGEIAELCELPPHQACEHLRLLKGQGHLESERRGRMVYYRIVNPRLTKILELIQSCREMEGQPEQE